MVLFLVGSMVLISSLPLSSPFVSPTPFSRLSLYFPRLARELGTCLPQPAKYCGITRSSWDTEWGRRISWIRVFETSMGNTAKRALFFPFFLPLYLPSSLLSPLLLSLLSILPLFPLCVAGYLYPFLQGLFPQTCWVLVILLPQPAKYYRITGILLVHPSKSLSFKKQCCYCSG